MQRSFKTGPVPYGRFSPAARADVPSVSKDVDFEELLLSVSQAKFQKKLDEVLRKKAEMEAQAVQVDGPEGKDSGEDPSQATAKERRRLEEQFSHYKKRNGMLNTRQVFDMLKSEEKKQTKVRLEHRIMLFHSCSRHEINQNNLQMLVQLV